MTYLKGDIKQCSFTVEEFKMLKSVINRKRKNNLFKYRKFK